MACALTGGADSLLNGVTVRDVDSVDNSRYGLFASAISGLSHLTITGGHYSHNNVGGANNNGRGIAVWDGPKSDIAITNVHAQDNRLVGIDINDGNVNGITISDNVVTGNGDSGIGVLGAKGPNANLISGNTVTDNGRYGIEIKNATGNGASSGAGSVVVSGNTVSRTVAATDLRDYAGIAVFRRTPGRAAQCRSAVRCGRDRQHRLRLPPGTPSVRPAMASASWSKAPTRPSPGTR